MSCKVPPPIADTVVSHRGVSVTPNLRQKKAKEDGAGHRVRAGRGTKLLHRIQDVKINAAYGYSKVARDFLTALSGGNKLQDVTFPLCQITFNAGTVHFCTI